VVRQRTFRVGLLQFSLIFSELLQFIKKSVENLETYRKRITFRTRGKESKQYQYSCGFERTSDKLIKTWQILSKNETALLILINKLIITYELKINKQ
jgi:hypothetical protein